MMKVSVHRRQRLGSLEFFGIGLEREGHHSVISIPEAERIVLYPPGIVRDTVALGIRASLALGAEDGEIEGVRWVKELAAVN